MKKNNCSPEMEMLLLAELISYPYHLGRVNLDPFTSLIVSPHARKVLGVLVEMRKNNEDVNLVNVSYRLNDPETVAALTDSSTKVTTDSSIEQHIGYLKELHAIRFLEMLALKMVQVSGDMSLSFSEKLNNPVNQCMYRSKNLARFFRRIIKRFICFPVFCVAVFSCHNLNFTVTVFIRVGI